MNTQLIALTLALLAGCSDNDSNQQAFAPTGVAALAPGRTYTEVLQALGPPAQAGLAGGAFLARFQVGGGVLELVFDPNTQRLHSWQQLAWEAPRDEYADLGGFEEAASDEPDGTELLFAMLALLNQGGAMDPGWAGIGGGGFSEAGFMGGGAQAAAAGGSLPFGFDGTYVPDDPSNPESAGYDPFIADSEGWPGGAYENPSSGYYDPGSFDTGGDF